MNNRWLSFSGLSLFLTIAPAFSAIGASCPPNRLVVLPETSASTGTPLVIDVLANDSDPCGVALDVVDLQENCPGRLIDHGDGAVTYVPAQDEEGVCQISYTVRAEDGAIASATATVMLDTHETSDIPTLDSRDPHWFFRHGRPLLLAGYYPGVQAFINDTQWGPSPAGTPGTFYRDMIDAAVDRRINLVRVVLTMFMALEDRVWLHPYERSASGPVTQHAADLGLSGAAYRRFDLNRINSVFFDYWNDIAAYANERGVILQIALLDGFHHRKEIGHFPPDPDPTPLGTYGRVYDYLDAANNTDTAIESDNFRSDASLWYTRPRHVERQRDFVRKAVATLCQFDNVIWETNNEPQAAHLPLAAFDNMTWHALIADDIRQTEAVQGCLPHIIMPIDAPEHRDIAGHFTPGDNNTDEDYQGVHDGIATLFARDPRPLIADNDCCVIPGNPEQLRKKAWTALVSGASASMLVYNAPRLGVSHPIVVDGMTAVGRTRQFVDLFDIDLVGMSPMTSPTDEMPVGLVPSNGFIWGLARTFGGTSQEYILYFFHPGSARIEGLPADRSAVWFDPRTGNTVPEPASGNLFDSRSVSSQDMVLYVRAADPNACEISFDAHPQDQTVTIGETAAFQVALAPGVANPTYRWHVNGQPLTADGNIAGVASATLSIASARLEHTGMYTVAVTDSENCSAVSQAGTLHVLPSLTTEIDDTFTLINGRVAGGELANTVTETGQRVWSGSSDLPAIFGGDPTNGWVTHDDAGDQNRQVTGGIAYDVDQLNANPVLTVTSEVAIGGPGWVGVGFSKVPNGQLLGTGQFWMLLREGGAFEIHTDRTSLVDPLRPNPIIGVASNFNVAGFNTLRLEYDRDAQTLSAWINSEQVAFRSLLPDNFGASVDIRYAGFQLNLKGGGSAGRQRIDDFQITTAPMPTRNRVPYLGSALAVPGRIEAEFYDLGGPGIGYHDVDLENRRNYRRPGAGYEAVDLTQFTGGAASPPPVVLSDMAAGEWLEYTVQIAQTADYRLRLDAATSTASAMVGMTIDGIELAGSPWTLPETHQWGLIDSFPALHLPIGLHVLRLRIDAPGVTINEFRLEPLEPEPGPTRAHDDLIIVTAPEHSQSFTIAREQILGNDEPGIEQLQIIATGQPNAKIRDGAIEYFPENSFWFRKTAFFDYTVRRLSGDSSTDSARVTLVAGGLAANDDYAVALCDTDGNPPSEPTLIAFESLLDNDLPEGLLSVVGLADPLPANLGTLTMVADAFRFQPAAAFCTTPNAVSFTYRVALIGAPEISDVAQVILLGSNPVVARDDVLAVPAGTSVVTVSDVTLLANDSPEGTAIPGNAIQSVLYDTVVEDIPFGHKMTVNPQTFWNRGLDEVTYRAELPSTCDEAGETCLFDTASIHLHATPSLGNETLLVPFTELEGILPIPTSQLLANDEPQLQPPRLTFDAAFPGTHGAAAKVAEEMHYRPNASFWDARVDEVPYQVRYVTDLIGEVTAQAKVTIVPEHGLEAVDDSLQVVLSAQPECSGGFGFHFAPGDLLANDLPAASYLELVSLGENTNGGGTIDAIGDGFGGFSYLYCTPSDWPPQAIDSTHYTVRLKGTDAVRQGRLWLFAGQPPPLQAIADTWVVSAGAASTISTVTLTANDLGGLGGELTFDGIGDPPLHGEIVEQNDGTLTYIPESGFVGTDHLTYRVAETHAPSGLSRHSQRGRVQIVVGAVLEAHLDVVLLEQDSAGLVIDPAALLANDLAAPGPAHLVGFSQAALGQVGNLGDVLLYTPSAAFFAAGEDSFSYTVELVNRPGTTATGLVKVFAQGACDTWLRDDFETATLDAWSAVESNGPGGVSVSVDAALDGAWGLEVTLDRGAEQQRLKDTSPESDRHYRAEFHFDPNGLNMGASDVHTLLRGRASTGPVFDLRLRSGYELRLSGRGDHAAEYHGNWVALANRPQRIFVEWWAATGPGVTDGGGRLWLDGVLVDQVDAIDNASLNIDSVFLGAVQGIDASTTGTYYFDTFRSCQGPQRRVLLFQDDVEGGDLTAWSSSVANGDGTLSAQPAAALEGGFGMEVKLTTQTQNLWVEDASPADARHYLSEFLFARGNLRHQGAPIAIHTGSGANGNVFALELTQTPDGSADLLSLAVRGDNGTTATAAQPLAPGVHRVQLEWRAATKPGTSDGHARFWIDGVLVADLQGIANFERTLERVRLGAIYGAGGATQGSFYLDSFASWLGPEHRATLLTDDFESGDTNAWTRAVTTGQGLLQLREDPALQGNLSLAATVGGAGDEARLEVDFTAQRQVTTAMLLDASALQSSDRDAIPILHGGGTNGGAFQLQLRRRDLQLEAALLAFQDQGSAATTGWVALPEGILELQITWRAAAAPGIPDGGIELRAGKTLLGAANGLANGTRTTATLRLGLLWGIDPGSVGTLTIDRVRVRP